MKYQEALLMYNWLTAIRSVERSTGVLTWKDDQAGTVRHPPRRLMTKLGGIDGEVNELRTKTSQLSL